MNKIILIIFFFPFIALGQIQKMKDSDKVKKFKEYYSNGNIKLEASSINGILVDTLKSYFKNGELKTIQIFKGMDYPRKVYYYENLKGMAAKSREGYYLQTSNINFQEEGNWNYYYKNGKVMDSLIYKNGKQIYRARYNKGGKLKFEYYINSTGANSKL